MDRDRCSGLIQACVLEPGAEAGPQSPDKPWVLMPTGRHEKGMKTQRPLGMFILHAMCGLSLCQHKASERGRHILEQLHSFQPTSQQGGQLAQPQGGSALAQARAPEQSLQETCHPPYQPDPQILGPVHSVPESSF